MNHARIGICYYPTTIVLIDDDKKLLEQLRLHLMGYENLCCLTFDDPKKSLDFLNAYKPDHFIEHCLADIEDSQSDHIALDFDVRKIHEKIYNKNRYKEITSLIIDYAMPSMNGLDVCRQLIHAFIKKIILTGEAGKELAVDAFNEGSIDKFIMKSVPDLVEVVFKYLKELQKKYFFQLSEMVTHQLTLTSQNKFDFLTDAVFVKFFNKLCEENNIIEYYLLDEQGSYLFLDVNGIPSWLVVADDEQMESYYQLAEAANAPHSIVLGLKDKTMMPFFFAEEDFEIKPAEWQQYLHSAECLQCKKTYYYSYIRGQHKYTIESSRVLSYQKFLEMDS